MELDISESRTLYRLVDAELKEMRAAYRRHRKYNAELRGTTTYDEYARIYREAIKRLEGLARKLDVDF